MSGFMRYWHCECGWFTRHKTYDIKEDVCPRCGADRKQFKLVSGRPRGLLWWRELEVRE